MKRSRWTTSHNIFHWIALVRVTDMFFETTPPLYFYFYFLLLYVQLLIAQVAPCAALCGARTFSLSTSAVRRRFLLATQRLLLRAACVTGVRGHCSRDQRGWLSQSEARQQNTWRGKPTRLVKTYAGLSQTEEWKVFSVDQWLSVEFRPTTTLWPSDSLWEVWPSSHPTRPDSIQSKSEDANCHLTLDARVKIIELFEQICVWTRRHSESVEDRHTDVGKITQWRNKWWLSWLLTQDCT